MRRGNRGPHSSDGHPLIACRDERRTIARCGGTRTAIKENFRGESTPNYQHDHEGGRSFVEKLERLHPKYRSMVDVKLRELLGTR
jgi:hypothetical protein